MLTLKLIVFTLALSSCVLGRDTHRGNTKHSQTEDEYKYNHPPIPETYEAVPVAVVYEGESNREDKSIKSNLPPENNTNDVSKKSRKPDSSVIEHLSSTTPISDIITENSPKIEDTKATTYRPQREQQIPVAVVYDPVPTNNQKSKPNDKKVSNKRTTIQPSTLEEKNENEEDNISSNIQPPQQVNGHTGIDLTSSANRSSVNRRRNKPERPEKQNTDTVNVDKSSLATSNKEEAKRRRIQKLAPEEPIASAVNKKIKSSNRTANKQEEVVTSKAKQNKIINDTKKIDKLEPIENIDNAKEYPARDNSTRVREVIPIVQSENVVFSHSGNFKYSYEGGDGTKAFEAGELRTFDNETAGEAVSGGFSFTAKDGNEYSLSYTADENGYRPVGAHLPTPPPIPPAIARALAYLATKTTPAPVTESLAEDQ